MKDETLEKISDRVYKKSIEQYEKESNLDTSKVISNQEFFEYVDKKINAAMAHNERYTENLVKEIIWYYQNKNQE